VQRTLPYGVGVVAFLPPLWGFVVWIPCLGVPLRSTPSYVPVPLRGFRSAGAISSTALPGLNRGRAFSATTQSWLRMPTCRIETPGARTASDGQHQVRLPCDPREVHPGHAACRATFGSQSIGSDARRAVRTAGPPRGGRPSIGASSGIQPDTPAGRATATIGYPREFDRCRGLWDNGASSCTRMRRCLTSSRATAKLHGDARLACLVPLPCSHVLPALSASALPSPYGAWPCLAGRSSYRLDA